MDRYHIYEAIGRGKHSVVYKGRRKKTIQYYAIKSVDKSQRQRVLQEVQVLRATSHPGVLRFHAWYETQNHLWLILEYCVGGDLLGVLKQDVALPEASVARFAADLCESLRVVHAAGTLHCDLKPSNVLMDEDGRLKLCGFGLARKVADVSASRTNASNATPSALARRGTPCYMAPELFEEGGSHSFASDLYAFGCVLYELAAGKPLLSQDTNNDALVEPKDLGRISVWHTISDQELAPVFRSLQRPSEARLEAKDGAGGGAPGIHRRLAPFAPFARFLERKGWGGVLADFFFFFVPERRKSLWRAPGLWGAPKGANPARPAGGLRGHFLKWQSAKPRLSHR